MGDVGELGKEVEEEEEVEELLREEKERNFSRVEEFNINTWKFREVNPAITRSLEDELDLSNWEPVAETLGLTNSQIERCLRSDAFTHAVFTTMEECPHFQDLTVKRFLKTLLEDNRRDILSKLEKFVRPKPGSDAAKTFTLSIQRDPQVLVVESCLDSVDGKQSGFQSKVVVIHAQDTREDALQLASQLRNPMEGNRLYVLLLQESKKNTQVKSSLRCDPWNSIHKWFIKVDAVLPVLSPQLLRQIQNRDFSRESEWEKRYNRFAHSMMLDQHVEYGSKNGFCRAVCPARFPEERCLRSDAFTHAVFTTMEECPHFQDLTVKRFLKTLLEHNRRDILSKLEKFVRPS
ncbi:uncharacterized protein LOC135099027 isoform X3 [Scylla paramamosain]|uniref:uncharacterized protein LOC135099027 isoform X3 n=1 Tax=Scylla paramamosain TaxID=85552 RepID=UPI003082C825